MLVTFHSYTILILLLLTILLQAIVMESTFAVRVGISYAFRTIRFWHTWWYTSSSHQRLKTIFSPPFSARSQKTTHRQTMYNGKRSRAVSQSADLFLRCTKAITQPESHSIVSSIHYLYQRIHVCMHVARRRRQNWGWQSRGMGAGQKTITDYPTRTIWMWIKIISSPIVYQHIVFHNFNSYVLVYLRFLYI